MISVLFFHSLLLIGRANEVSTANQTVKSCHTQWIHKYRFYHYQHAIEWIGAHTEYHSPYSYWIVIHYNEKKNMKIKRKKTGRRAKKKIRVPWIELVTIVFNNCTRSNCIINWNQQFIPELHNLKVFFFTIQSSIKLVF